MIESLHHAGTRGAQNLNPSPDLRHRQAGHAPKGAPLPPAPACNHATTTRSWSGKNIRPRKLAFTCLALLLSGLLPLYAQTATQWDKTLVGKLAQINMAPVAMAQNLTTTQDVPLSIPLSGTDAENQALSFHSVQGPSHGTLSGTALDLVYTPAPGYQGEDAFSYAASDGQLTSPPATVAITVAPPPLSYRLNAGGTQVSAATGIFAADNYFAPAPGFTYSSATLIAGTGDDALYQTERSSPVDNGRFGYNLPLANGTYSVVLHFAELYWNAPGQRVFDVALEGALALDNYDIIKKTGVKNTATTETFLVTVIDGMLNINLDAGAEVGGVNRPKISALEVLPYTGAYSFPVAKAGPDRTITLPEENLILDGRGTETHGRVDLFTWTQVSGPNKATFYPYTSAPSVTRLLPGTYVFSLTIVDDQEAVGAPDQMTLTVLPDSNAPQVLPTHRLNAGGTQVTASPGVFLG